MATVKDFFVENMAKIMREADKNRSSYDFMRGIETVNEFIAYMRAKLSLLEHCSQKTDFSSITDFLDFVEKVYNEIHLVCEVLNVKENSYTLCNEAHFTIYSEDKNKVYVYHDTNY